MPIMKPSAPDIAGSNGDSEIHGQADGGSVMQCYIDVCTKHLDPYENVYSLAQCASLEPVPPLCRPAAEDFLRVVCDHTGIILQRWLHDADIGTLRINGPSGSGKAFLACTILQGLHYWVRGSRRPVISYNIPPARPSEVFTARGVLASLCQQALLKFPNASNVEDICAFLLDAPEAILSKDVFRAILCSLVASLSSETVFCFVTGIENLEDSHRSDLINDLDIIMSHTERVFSKFKLLVTTDSNQTPHLTCPQQVLRLDQSHAFCRFLMQFFQNRKCLLLTKDKRGPPVWELLGMSKSIFSAWLLNSSENMTDLALKTGFLQSSQPTLAKGKGDAVNLVSKIQKPLSEQYATVLRDLANAGPGISRLSIIWILFSIRPLGPWDFSLCNAIGLNGQDAMGYAPSRPIIEQAISENPVCDLSISPLGHICHFVHDEIHLSHGPRHYHALLKILQSGNGVPPNQAHLFLFNQCLSYLSTMLISNTYSPYGIAKHRSFMSYAALYWPEHYQRACAEETTHREEAAQRVVEFLQNETLFREWIKLYNNESFRTPSARFDLEGTTRLESPLEVATYFKLDRVFDLILSTCPRRDQWNSKHVLEVKDAPKALRIAISNGNSHAIRELSKRFSYIGVPLDAERKLASRGHDYRFGRRSYPNDDGDYTPFQELVLRGHPAGFLGDGQKFLLLNQFRQRSKSLRLTPLHLAARVGSLEVVKALVTGIAGHSGINRVNEYINTCDELGNNAMMYTADDGFYKITHFFFEGHIEVEGGTFRPTMNVNKADSECNTALHLAARRGAAKVVSLLLAHNARTDIQNTRGETSLHLACQQGSLRVVICYFHGIRSQNGETPNLVPGIIRSAIVARDIEGNTPLHVAAAHGYPDIVDFLLDSNRNPDIHVTVDLLNKIRKTPLHLAARAGHLENCKSLLKAGAFKLALDTNGSNPMDCAKKGGHEGIVHLFGSPQSA